MNMQAYLKMCFLLGYSLLQTPFHFEILKILVILKQLIKEYPKHTHFLFEKAFVKRLA